MIFCYINYFNLIVNLNQKTSGLVRVHDPHQQHAADGDPGLVGGGQPVHHAAAAAARRPRPATPVSGRYFHH